MSDAARIAALEAQVAALTARLDAASRVQRADVRDGDGRPMDRRAVLRRGGFALAGLAAAPLLMSDPAAAATGNPVTAGATTSANNGDVTRLTASNPGRPVLEVANTDAGAAAQPIVRLTSASAARTPSPTVGDRGDLAVGDEAFLYFAHTGPASGDASVVWGSVYTSAFANFLEVLPQPRRVLDTRTGVGTGGSSGKRAGGSETVVDLSGIVVEGVAAFGNLTVTEPEGSGFLSTYPDTRPTPLTSSINFTRAQTIANFTLVGLVDDAFTIYASQRTHIVFDVVGVLVSDLGQVDTTTIAGTTAARLAKPSRG